MVSYSVPLLIFAICIFGYQSSATPVYDADYFATYATLRPVPEMFIPMIARALGVSRAEIKQMHPLDVFLLADEKKLLSKAMFLKLPAMPAEDVVRAYKEFKKAEYEKKQVPQQEVGIHLQEEPKEDVVEMHELKPEDLHLPERSSATMKYSIITGVVLLTLYLLRKFNTFLKRRGKNIHILSMERNDTTFDFEEETPEEASVTASLSVGSMET